MTRRIALIARLAERTARLPLASLAALAALVALAGAEAAAAGGPGQVATRPATAPPDCPPVARAPTPEQVQAGFRDARDHGFLWQIDKDGRRSYLYGTMHVATLAWMFPGPGVQRAFDASDTVALELDLLDPEVQRGTEGALAARHEPALPKPLATRLRRQMDAACVAPEALATTSAELQIATLSLLVARRDGLDPAYGIDLFLSSLARSRAKRIVSLETPALQLQALQTQGRAATLEVVRRGLAELESGRARPLLRRIAKIWADSDLVELERYERWCGCVHDATDRAAIRRLLDDRNPGLADAIDALHARGGSVFAAVGSLHMIGPRGLPALLAQRGYRVERVAYAARPSH